MHAPPLFYGGPPPLRVASAMESPATGFTLVEQTAVHNADVVSTAADRLREDLGAQAATTPPPTQSAAAPPPPPNNSSVAASSLPEGQLRMTERTMAETTVLELTLSLAEASEALRRHQVQELRNTDQPITLAGIDEAMRVCRSPPVDPNHYLSTARADDWNMANTTPQAQDPLLHAIASDVSVPANPSDVQAVNMDSAFASQTTSIAASPGGSARASSILKDHFPQQYTLHYDTPPTTPIVQDDASHAQTQLRLSPHGTFLTMPAQRQTAPLTTTTTHSCALSALQALPPNNTEAHEHPNNPQGSQVSQQCELDHSPTLHNITRPPAELPHPHEAQQQPDQTPDCEQPSDQLRITQQQPSTIHALLQPTHPTSTTGQALNVSESVPTE